METIGQQHTSTFFTAHPEPFHIFWFVVIFILNFMICRYLSIQLVKAGYIRKHPLMVVTNKKRSKQVPNTAVTTEEYKKLFLFWFVPVVGAAGLIVLYVTHMVKTTVINIKNKLFLQHI
jgi:hypothetical protein